jgi:hypothetical protein
MCLFPVVLFVHLSVDRKNFHDSCHLASPLVVQGRGGVPKDKIAALKNGFIPPGNRTARLIWHSSLDAIAFRISELFSSTHVSEICYKIRPGIVQ